MRTGPLGRSMRWLAGFLFALLVVPGQGFADAPQLLNVQGVVRDTAGEPATGTFSIRFALYASQTAGSPLWSQVVPNVAVSGGVFATVVGADPANPLPATLFADQVQVWLGVRVEAEAELPRQRLVSVPYAIEANRSLLSEVANGLDCDGCVLVDQLGFDPATQTELNAVQTSLDNLRANPLAGISCTAGYILVYQGGQWTCTGDYVTSAQLGGYVTSAQLDARLAAMGQTLGSLACQAGQTLAYAGAGTGWACSSDFATVAALNAVSTAVTNLTATVNALDAELAAHAADVAAHHPPYGDEDVLALVGQTLGQLACAADEVAVFDGTEWVCRGGYVQAPTAACTGDGMALQWTGTDWACIEVQAGQLPDEPCTGAWETLQWDGTAYTCVDLRASGLSQGRANGFEVIDDWGYAWDGTERGAKTWAQADTDCTSRGGRLPTITEIFRNNATSGSGNIGTTSNTNELWTLISNYQGNRVTVRVSDGNVNYRAPTGTYQYRCVWPDHTSSAFDGDYCYGPPNTECQSVRRFYNLDKWDRPSVDMVAASHECNFYNGSIPMFEDWMEMIHAGQLTGTWGTWLWAGDIMYYGGSPYLLQAIVNFSADRARYWAYDSYQNNFGSWQWPSSASRFRCIGKRSASEGVNPSSPACQGGCFSMIPSADQTADHAGRRSPIWADSANRTATTRDGASQQCAAVGGALPTGQEFMELVHAGWPFNTGSSEHTAWLWTSSPVYHGNYQNLLARRGTWTNAKTWYVYHSDNMSWDAGNSQYAFRCVWHQTQRATPFTCSSTQVMNWDGTQYSCVTRNNGDAAGQANGGPWMDAWGNVWDTNQRDANSWSGAGTVCSAIGARLPTATELYRLRSGGPNPIPNATANYLWTNLPSYRIDYAAALRLSDGGLTDNCSTGSCTNYNFRCVWPTTAGTAFGGMSCSGPTSGGQDPCFRAGRYVTDKMDRAKIYAATAAHECQFYGGWLSSLRQFEEVVHLGAPNGDWSSWSWLLDTMYASYFRMGLARWSGVGTAGWYWNNQITSTASLDYAHGGYTFRCVFHDLLR